MFAEDELAGCDEAAQEASVINAPTPLTEATSHPAFTAGSLPREIEMASCIRHYVAGDPRPPPDNDHVCRVVLEPGDCGVHLPVLPEPAAQINVLYDLNDPITAHCPLWAELASSHDLRLRVIEEFRHWTASALATAAVARIEALTDP
jgi:hypothetical protein